ncbi:sulfotransferase [uncultured Shimia sp.]|uniref:sulfotransferase family protein n=1 Tax=uncultured Shimia sp. TaxID=573152 RepID=UPI0025CE291E|nr:sulfotransferase [uncultured Shimia sp.]
MRLPNTIAIGAGKAGSTSLHNYLHFHPQIFGSREKELMYFTSRFDRGEEWYQSNFPIEEGVKVYFETTPQYSFRDEFPGVPERIFEYNPDMKLLYIVREPLSRIVSHFNHWTRTQPQKYTNLEASLGLPSHRKRFIDRTRYFYQLSAFLDVFPDNQIQVVFLEDLKADFAGTLDTIFEFLGVDCLGADIPQKVHNRGSRPEATSRKWSVGEISQERRQEICATLSEDVQKLFSFCGKPADYWGAAYT